MSVHSRSAAAAAAAASPARAVDDACSVTGSRPTYANDRVTPQEPGSAAWSAGGGPPTTAMSSGRLVLLMANDVQFTH